MDGATVTHTRRAAPDAQSLLGWPEVASFFEEHGCVMNGAIEMAWYEEAWAAVEEAGRSEGECTRLVMQLRALALLAMYLGIYQAASGTNLDGFFSGHGWLSDYVAELGIAPEALDREIAESIDSTGEEEIEERWKEVVVVMVEEETAAVFHAIRQHFDGDIGLFVSLWNSRRREPETPDRVVNTVEWGDGKPEVWAYVQGGMRGWSFDEPC